MMVNILHSCKDDVYGDGMCVVINALPDITALCAKSDLRIIGLVF